MICSALQALAKGNTTKAVKCLRMELAPLQVDTVQLHDLANAVMCQDEDDLQKVMDWAGPDNGSRQHLLNSLQVCNVDMMLAHCHPPEPSCMHAANARFYAWCCFCCFQVSLEPKTSLIFQNLIFDNLSSYVILHFQLLTLPASTSPSQVCMSGGGVS